MCSRRSRRVQGSHNKGHACFRCSLVLSLVPMPDTSPPYVGLAAPILFGAGRPTICVYLATLPPEDKAWIGDLESY